MDARLLYSDHEYVRAIDLLTHVIEVNLTKTELYFQIIYITSFFYNIFLCCSPVHGILVFAKCVPSATWLMEKLQRRFLI